MTKVLEQTIPNEPEVEETKAECFKRLADKRVTVALDKIRLVGNLSVRGNYEYTEEQVQRIEQTLVDMVAHTMNKFRKREADKPHFEL